MRLPSLTYLSFDGLSSTVGASQVAPYVEGLGRHGMSVTLHSFESSRPPDDLMDRLRHAGVKWVPHAFGKRGAVGGVQRLLRGAALVRGEELVHARGDLPAGSASLARCQSWLWDMRGLWADERIEVGTLRQGSVEERIVRFIERRAAESAGAIVALARASVPVLADRHGSSVAAKVHVIPTCVDLERFTLSDLPPPQPLRLLLSGTLNARYDVPTMIRFVERIRLRHPTNLEVLMPAGSPWADQLRAAGALVDHARAADMPRHVAKAHGGLVILRPSATGANLASMPTKLGEFLATGRPVVVSAGLGDMDQLLARSDCGVVVSDPSEAGLDHAADELLRLVADPGSPDRCRTLASTHFDIREGVTRLRAAYESVVSRRARGCADDTSSA